MRAIDSAPVVLRPSVLAFRIDDTLQFVQTGSGIVKVFSADDLAFGIVQELSGGGIKLSDLETTVRTVPGYSAEHFAEIIDILRQEQLIQHENDHLRSRAPTLFDVDRFDRQLRLFTDLVADGKAAPGQTAVDLQNRLSDATVTVIGVGGFGGSVVSALAAAGVGTLRLVDDDCVEASNLPRQFLFGPRDIGRPKLLVAAERLAAINPEVQVECITRRVRSEHDLDEAVDGADLVINCADQPSVIDTCEWVSRACHRQAVPHIVGGAYAYQLGGIGIAVKPGETACWSCFRAETATDFDRDRAQPIVGRRGPGPAIAMVSGTVGNVVAWEAIRILTGMRSALYGRWAEIDLWTLETQFRTVRRRDDCGRCVPDPLERKVEES